MGTHITLVLVCAKAKSITDLSVDCLITSGRQLSIVKGPGFKGCLTFLEPDYTLHSRTQIASSMKNRHRYVKKDLGDLLEAVALVRADVLILRELIGSRQRIDKKILNRILYFIGNRCPLVKE